MMDIIYTFLIVIFSFLPILLWGYIFSHFDDSSFNRTRFFLWLWAWFISVFPILYLPDLLSQWTFSFLNMFYYIYNLFWISDLVSFFSRIWLFVLVLLIISFILALFFFSKKLDFKNIFKLYFKNFIILSIFLVFISIFIFFLNYIFSFFPFLTTKSTIWVSFWDLFFNSLKLIIFYYIIVWIIEELSKYLSFFSSSFLYIKSVKTGVLYAVFVALWFSFIENILYFQSLFENNWFSGQLVTTYFFRSIFSVMLHVLCSFVVSYYFTTALLKYRGLNLSFPYFKTFFYWLIVSIILHTVFDVALTLSLTFFIFVYFIGWYFYMTWVFYKDKE